MWIAALIASPIGAVGVYAINSVLVVFMAIWLAIFGVETRGKTLEEITKPVLTEE